MKMLLHWKCLCGLPSNFKMDCSPVDQYGVDCVAARGCATGIDDECTVTEQRLSEEIVAFLAGENFGRMFDHSFLACTFFF